MSKSHITEEDTLLIEELQFLLQEKRTALKIVRTGAAVFMAEIAAAGYLISAIKRHAFLGSAFSHPAMILLGAAISVIAIGLMICPAVRIRLLDRKILKFKQRHEQRRVLMQTDQAQTVGGQGI